MNLLVVNDDPVYKASIRGSATGLHFKQRYYVVCCFHQIRDVDPERVALITKDGQSLITSAGVRHFIERGDTDFQDLAVFDFTDPCLAHPDLKERFYSFTEVAPEALNTETIFVQVSGYPTADQSYDLADNNALGFVKRLIHCDLQRPPADDAMALLAPHQPLQFSVDGLSGGSAFTVQIVDNLPRAYFAGIVMRAGSNDIFILKSGYIKSVLAGLSADDGPV
jgi:hypothetical protein